MKIVGNNLSATVSYWHICYPCEWRQTIVRTLCGRFVDMSIDHHGYPEQRNISDIMTFWRTGGSAEIRCRECYDKYAALAMSRGRSK